MANARVTQTFSELEKMKEKGVRTLTVANIQRSCVHDGKGLRTTVFFKGCGLRCLWCQNPENLTAEPRENDLTLSVDGLIEILKKDAQYYRATDGGVTLSGGDPLLQDADALLELVKALDGEGIPVNVETTLFVPWQTIEKVAPYINTFLVDFKVCGDSACHKRLTGQSDEKIRENVVKLQKLIKKMKERKPEIRLRMVIVPGYNNSPEQLRAAAEYIKSIGFDTLELLQYWNFYEDKAKRLGIDVPQLHITQKEALTALKEAAPILRENGLNIWSDYLQKGPYHAEFTERVRKIRQDLWDAKREISFETSFLKTEYYKKNKGFKKPAPIHRSERLKYVLSHRTVTVWDGELLVGNYTDKRIGGQVWEEQYGILYAMFLYKADRQTPVPFYSSPEDRKRFYWDVFPYWLTHSLAGRFLIKGGASQALQTFSSVAEQKVGFLNNFAAIAHFSVNFERLLENGTTGLKEEVHRLMREHPENNRDFYKGVITSLEALEIFAERYVYRLRDMAKKEKDETRKAELLKMARICEKVPKFPAETFHEALQSMLFLQIALGTEQYENAISLGRVDQLLQPYYERDVAAGIIDYEHAKELLALFVLKLDETILVNDGDGILNVGKLFETLSVDQALTFGGVKPDGTDGTNDVTYMLCDICELLPLAVNMCARINENSPQEYLDRLANLYIGGCPMPELFSDTEYIKSLDIHYHETPENCRNYAIVGCVEPIASSEHFGNTDSANMNVTLPLLQAMKGLENDLWNYGLPEQLEKFFIRFGQYFFRTDSEKDIKVRKKLERMETAHEKLRGHLGAENYKPARSMEELLRRYQTQLNRLARSILADQQKLERILSQTFTAPLASSLYKSALQRGLDVYEGGTDYNTAGIQAVGITDTADSFLAIDELVFKQKKYTMSEMIEAVDNDFEGEKYKQLYEDIAALPKFGDDSSEATSKWVTKTMEMYNLALAQCPFEVRNHGKYGAFTAGYYALNTSDRYGKYMGALPSGHRKGTPLANSVAPHHGAAQDDLLSALNDVGKVDFANYAVNGTTVTLTVDAAIFPGKQGVRNLGQIFRTFLTKGGMQFQPNVVSRELLQDAYDHPDKHPYLMVRVAGYCAYFNELSDELKKIIIGRTCYA